MKCVIKRPKLIIKNTPLEKSYFVIYFSQNHFKSGKRQYSLFKINIGKIESSSKTYFSKNRRTRIRIKCFKRFCKIYK